MIQMLIIVKPTGYSFPRFADGAGHESSPYKTAQNTKQHPRADFVVERGENASTRLRQLWQNRPSIRSNTYHFAEDENMTRMFLEQVRLPGVMSLDVPTELLHERPIVREWHSHDPINLGHITQMKTPIFDRHVSRPMLDRFEKLETKNNSSSRAGFEDAHGGS